MGVGGGTANFLRTTLSFLTSVVSMPVCCLLSSLCRGDICAALCLSTEACFRSWCTCQLVYSRRGGLLLALLINNINNKCGVTSHLLVLFGVFIDSCRMQFFHEGDAPPVPQALQPLPLPPAGEGESPEIGTATPPVVAVEHGIAADGPVRAAIPGGACSPSSPSFGGALQQQGGTDGSMSSPPPVVMENRTLVVYPPECLLHM